MYFPCFVSDRVKWNPKWQISTACCWTLDEFGENRFTEKQNLLKGLKSFMFLLSIYIFKFQ